MGAQRLTVRRRDVQGQRTCRAGSSGEEESRPRPRSGLLEVPGAPRLADSSPQPEPSRHTRLPAGCVQTALSTKTPVTRSEAPPCVTSFPLPTAARALFPRRSTFRSDAGQDLGKPIRGGHNSTHTAPRRGFSTSTAVCRVTAVVVPHWTWDPRGPDLGDGPLRPRGRGAVACRSNQL